MRRDSFTLDVRDADWPEGDGDSRLPTLAVNFSGSADELRERLATPDGDLLEADETDVTCRLLGDLDDADTTAVVGVTDRTTGDYVFELDADAGRILRFIRAARQYGEREHAEAEYRLTIAAGDEELASYEKTTFLVYDADGDLRRQHSLIPGGVEL